MENHDSRIAHPHEASTDERASSDQPRADGFGFEPIPLRYRRDGLTPEKQRDYVEALADCGVAREAAARIGVSEQAVGRARRRADAKSFDLACEAAVRFGARKIRSIAFERAIEGTIRRHYYHGELKSEERVFDNRLLIYLLGKLDRLIEPPARADQVAANWESWMEAIEQGLPAPPGPKPAAVEQSAHPAEFDGNEVWEDDYGTWWTEFPPPPGFAGEEEGSFGEDDYRRTLSPEEQAVIDSDSAEDRADELAFEAARRDRYFGFVAGGPEAEVFSPREAETYETSAPQAPNPELVSGSISPSPGPDEGEEAPAETATSALEEAGLSGPFEPAAAPAAGAEEAGPVARAELYEPSWLCTGSARQDHSTESSDGARAPRDE